MGREKMSVYIHGLVKLLASVFCEKIVLRSIARR